MSSVVVKLGGSILFSQGGIQRFMRWWKSRPETSCAMIVGGGETVESMRLLNDYYPFEQVAMHWRCIRLMDATFECMAECLPECTAIAHESEFADLSSEMQTWEDSAKNVAENCKRLWLVRVGAFHHPESNDDLPRGWSVTSDSLAWVLAKKVSIQRICLLKSCVIPASTSWTELASLGIIDECFPTICDDSIAVEVCSI